MPFLVLLRYVVPGRPILCPGIDMSLDATQNHKNGTESPCFLGSKNVAEKCT